MSGNVEVSIIIPLLNEEKYIDKCLNSLAKQTYPLEQTEWILVDGLSEDRTVEIIETYKNQYPIVLLTNEERKTPYGLNKGIRQSKGKYIIRMDAHAEFAKNYVEKCIFYLEHTDADNVGGIAETRAVGAIGEAIAGMLSTKFGVGNSDFRTNGADGYVDTVPFGAFRRSTFEKYGMFNTELLRSEDNELNARIRKNGGKVYLSREIKFVYYCRNTVGSVLAMGLQNGNALFRTRKVDSSAMRVRHYIPFIFLISLIVMPILSAVSWLFRLIFCIELSLYLVLDIYFSFIKLKAYQGIITLWLYPLFHICYGAGSLLGLINVKLY